MGIESYRAKPEPKEEAEEITLKELLNDTKKSGLFGEFLDELKETGLGERLASKTLKEGDEEALGAYKKDFLELMGKVEKIRETLTPEQLNAFAEQSDKLKAFKSMVGTEGLQKSFFPFLEKVAIRDNGRFVDIMESLDRLAKMKERREELNDNIREALQRYRIPIREEEYFAILRDTPDEFDREIKLERLIRERAGFWQSRKIIKESGDLFTEAMGLDRKDEIEHMLVRIDKSMGTTGEMLGGLMSEVPEVHAAYQQILAGERVEEEKIMSFREATRLIPSEEELRKLWEEQELKGVLKDDFEIERLLDYGKKVGGKKGFWVNISGGLMKALINML